MADETHPSQYWVTRGVRWAVEENAVEELGEDGVAMVHACPPE